MNKAICSRCNCEFISCKNCGKKLCQCTNTGKENFCSFNCLYTAIQTYVSEQIEIIKEKNEDRIENAIEDIKKSINNDNIVRLCSNGNCRKSCSSLFTAEIGRKTERALKHCSDDCFMNTLKK